MPAHEFIIRYKEYGGSSDAWKETLFSLGEWPYDDSLPDEKIENHPEKSPKWFSAHFGGFGVRFAFLPFSMPGVMSCNITFGPPPLKHQGRPAGRP